MLSSLVVMSPDVVTVPASVAPNVTAPPAMMSPAAAIVVTPVESMSTVPPAAVVIPALIAIVVPAVTEALPSMVTLSLTAIAPAALKVVAPVELMSKVPAATRVMSPAAVVRSNVPAVAWATPMLLTSTPSDSVKATLPDVTLSISRLATVISSAAPGWCRKVGGKLENWRKLLIVKHSERRCAAAERSLRHETSYGIDVAQSIFR